VSNLKSELKIETDEAIRIVTLNRPERRNALSLALMQELTATLRGFETGVRAVVISGSGPAFCAGHDLAEMIDRSVADYRQIFDACVELMETIQRIPQPVIAEVNGTATAAGCQLVASL
jgi:enoyl-CoA hydratase/carnithine racemase